MRSVRLLTSRSLGSRSSADDDEAVSGVVSSSHGAAAAAPELPSRFRIKELLGQGGMGVVYKAYDVELATDVALKTLNRVSAHDLYYLKREFRTLAGIRHPNLINLYELFADGQTCFFTMELIVGTDLVTYVRPDGAGFDETRLRDATRQLALAVSAIHAAKRLHRDIKPPNVMVTKAGRLVLLDFGLALALSPDSGQSEKATFAGTHGYMAPEQLRAETELTAAADWYCTGAALYEAATGVLPFETPLRALIRRSPPPRVRERRPDFPEDLDQLIAELLDPVAEQRPTGQEILGRLGVGDALRAGSVRASSVPATGSGPFEGRLRETELLRTSLEDVRSGKGAVVRVYGPSGIGKSELARRFVDDAVRGGATVLRGRCHPQETVVFNALDEAVDDLSRVLDSMPREGIEAVVPRNVDALIRIFPVLGRVEAIAEASVNADASVGAGALRKATRAFAQLLGALSRRQTLVLWIDDAQWGDVASGSMLEELVSSRDAPALLLLLTYRSDDTEGSPTLDDVARAVTGGGLAAVDLPLGPLSERDSRSLMENLLAGEGTEAAEHLIHLATETDGSPFYIRELAHYISSVGLRDESVPSRVQLSDILQARLRSLSPTAKSILEVVSVAGGPLEQQVLVRATGAADSVRLTLQRLEQESLVRTVVLDTERRTEVYHHRIRDQVLDALADEERRKRHRAIADAMLTVDRPQLGRVVEHYEAAGELAAVRRYVVAAAKHAADSLAFDLAAKLYGRAIELGGTELDESELRARLGDVLGSAGRDWRAGAEFERAASLAASKQDLRARVPYLRQRAAMQYLKSGHREDAERALAAVLAALGFTLPKTRTQALLRTLWQRGLLMVRGLEFERRDPTQIPRTVLDRVDLLQVLGMSLALIDHTKSHWLGTRTLLEALDAGEVSRVRIALANECVTWCSAPDALHQRQANRMFELLKEINKETSEPLYRGGEHTVRGLIAWFRGHAADAAHELACGKALFRTVREGAAFHITSCEAFRLPALAQLGRIRQLTEELEADLRDAEDRADEFFVASCAAGEPSIVWLAQDRPEIALQWADRVMRSAPPDYSSQHYFRLVTYAQTLLYQGQPGDACRLVEAEWPQLKANFFLTLSWVRDELADLRARASVAAAVAMGRGGESPRRGVGVNGLLAIAEREARNIERHRLPFARPLAASLRASVAAVRGRRQESVALLREAAVRFQEIQMDLHHHASVYALGAASELQADRARAQESEVWMRGQGIAHPSKIAGLFVPGFTLPSKTQ